MDLERMNSLAANLIKLLPLLHGTVINLDDFNTDADLGRAHYEILACLEGAENMMQVDSLPMTNISKSMNISKPYLTTLTDRLINKGYIERIPDCADRRIVRIKLTESGRFQIKEHFVLMREAAVKKLGSLEIEELEGFSSSLEAVTSILEKVQRRVKDEAKKE